VTRYQLAKLVEWAGSLNSRKRLQKVVFLLQAAGCPLEADFYLHHYGTYSEDVARLTDEMVRLDLLKETSEPFMGGSKYSYQLSEPAQRQLAELEQTDRGRGLAVQLAPFEAKAKALLAADVKQLEYASTILYFRLEGNDWPEAADKAVQFKGTSLVRNALGLAQQALA
jgi:uncharacterized protein YwgA